jgi:hypothetical protein
LSGTDAKWLKSALKLASDFATEHSLTLATTDRQLSASFEIGCLHALVNFYKDQGYSADPTDLNEEGEFRYLTTPSGNPDNYSYILLSGIDGKFELRQQVRIRSHLDPHIAFTPDILVVTEGADITKAKDLDFAGGKRPFFCVEAASVVAAHECKSMNPFPELLVSFIGMLAAAHSWYPTGVQVTHTKNEGHLAPTLFVGGTARALHQRMISAMGTAFRLNIVCGLHEGTWTLTKAKNRLVWSPGGTPPPGLVSEDDVPF